MIGYNIAPNYHSGRGKEHDSYARSPSTCRRLCAGSSFRQGQAFVPTDALLTRQGREEEAPLRKGVRHFALSSELSGRGGL